MSEYRLQVAVFVGDRSFRYVLRRYNFYERSELQKESRSRQTEKKYENYESATSSPLGEL